MSATGFALGGAASSPERAQDKIWGMRDKADVQGDAGRRPLLDTNVVSELRRIRPHGALVKWWRGVDAASLRLSAVTLARNQTGIEITLEQDPVKAAEIELWADKVAADFNIPPMDAVAYRLSARLAPGRADALHEDAMIGATAMAHNLAVVTRDLRDFKPSGVRTFDPFAA